MVGILIIQKVYPYDGNTDELIYYVRKGFIQNNDTIKWGKWFLVSLYLEDLTTYVIKGYKGSRNLFKNLIPSSVTSIIFTDINMPSNATLIDADDDGDGGIVAWLNTYNNTKMHVSTQKEGQKVIGNNDSRMMFRNCTGLTTLDLSNFDTSNVTGMSTMFADCSGLTTLDLSNFDTNNISYGNGEMNGMFAGCDNLTTIKVGNKFNWVTDLSNLGLLYSTWQDETGTQYTTTDTFPSNEAHTYTKVS